jgi:hypothetical protein
MIIHFWDLPENRNYIILKDELKKKIITLLKNKKYPWKIKNKIKNSKISIKKIKDIAKKENLVLVEIEKNILRISGNNSKGLSNPKFPINFDSREGARFIAAIVNDGTLTKESKNSRGRLMYDNFDETLRNSVIQDYLTIFGGDKKEIAFRNTEKKKYLEFSSVIRDMVELVIKEKGPKCESNLNIPNFVFKSKKNMCGWIEQTIADEGDVKYYPNKYRRAIAWRRSLDITPLVPSTNKAISIRKLPKEIQEIVQKQKCNLISGEEKMLKILGIKYKLYNLGIYSTVKNKTRTRWQIDIAKRKNLLKLRGLIKIPSKSKDLKFNAITHEFIRYKEPLKIKKGVIELGKKQSSFTSID